MNHPHKIDYYAFPPVSKPVVLTYDKPSDTFYEVEELDMDWWEDPEE